MVNQTQQEILNAITKQNGITGKELSEIVGKTSATVRKHCMKLVEAGLIHQKKRIRFDSVTIRDGLFGNPQAKRTFYTYRILEEGETPQTLPAKKSRTRKRFPKRFTK